MDEISHFLTVTEEARQPSSQTDTAERFSMHKYSIEILSNAFPSTDINRRFIDATIVWPFFVGLDFIRLLKENNSIALVVLGFYGIALHSFRSIWWLYGLGARLVQVVSRVILPMHLPLLQRPLAKISTS